MSGPIVTGAATIGVEPAANVRDWLSPPDREHLGDYVIVRREDERVTAVLTPAGSLSQLEAQAAIVSHCWAADVVPTIGGAS